MNLNIAEHIEGPRPQRRRPRRRRQCWTKLWILRRKEFGMYDQLMRTPVHSRTSCACHLKCILERVRGRLTKQHTFYREPLEPGLKLAVTLRHLASGSKYAEMKFWWRVPANTISVLVREVCQAILHEYLDEVMTPPSIPEAWREIAHQFRTRWNFPHCCGALDGKHVQSQKSSQDRKSVV